VRSSAVDEFGTLLRYARNLAFTEAPNYSYLSGLFVGLMKRSGWTCDWDFDWIGIDLVSIYCRHFCCRLTALVFAVTPGIDVKTFLRFFILVTFFTFLTFFLFSKRFLFKKNVGKETCRIELQVLAGI